MSSLMRMKIKRDVNEALEQFLQEKLTLLQQSRISAIVDSTVQFNSDTIRHLVFDCFSECGVSMVERSMNKSELHSLKSVILITKSNKVVFVSHFTTNGDAFSEFSGTTLPFNEYSSFNDKCVVFQLKEPLISFVASQPTPIVGHGGIGNRRVTFKDVWPSLRNIARKEKSDIWILLAYSVLTSGLGLVIPLSSQSIVNSVSLGVFNSQLVVLCGVVLVVMIGLAFLVVAERYIVDMIQRRLFVHTSLDIATSLPRVTHEAVKLKYTPELVNRFFDVMTIQKSLSKFLLDGVNGVLVLVSGLVLLAFYHPFFIIYDVLFLLFVPILVMLLGRGAIDSAVNVSAAKYQTASLLEDIARAQLSFKLLSATPFGFDRINTISLWYLQAKRQHFFIVSRQVFGSYIFKALAIVGILGVGGALVIQQQLSLGQLVAAEIVIIMIIGALEKLLGQFDSYYDMTAALDKLSYVMNQPTEAVGGQAVPSTEVDVVVRFSNVSLSFDRLLVLENLNLELRRGDQVSIVGHSGGGKTTMMHLLLGLIKPDSGVVQSFEINVQQANLASIRQHIGYVFPEDQLIPGSILENITFGRDLTMTSVLWAITQAQCSSEIDKLPGGILYHVKGDGSGLAFGLRKKILIARAIVSKPRLLILDEAFEGIEDSHKLSMINSILSVKDWTVVNVSHDPEVVAKTDYIYVLDEGRIVESGSPAVLSQNVNSVFNELFPNSGLFQAHVK